MMSYKRDSALILQLHLFDNGFLNHIISKDYSLKSRLSAAEPSSTSPTVLRQAAWRCVLHTYHLFMVRLWKSVITLTWILNEFRQRDRVASIDWMIDISLGCILWGDSWLRIKHSDFIKFCIWLAPFVSEVEFEEHKYKGSVFHRTELCPYLLCENK